MQIGKKENEIILQKNDTSTPSATSAFFLFSGVLFLLFVLFLSFFFYFRNSRFSEQKEELPPEYLFAYAISAGQFEKVPHIYITPRCGMGEKLFKKGFPGSFHISSNLFSGEKLLQNLPDDSSRQEKEVLTGNHKEDILFAVHSGMDFSSDAFFTAGYLFPLKEKLAKDGVFVLLLPQVKADLYQKIVDHTAPILCSIYKNVLPVAYPQMILASDRVLITDQEKLEKNLLSFTEKEKSPFPASFLQIFTPHLSKGRLLTSSKENPAKSLREKESFPWELREKCYDGFYGDLWYLFRLWSEFFHQYFYGIWGGIILLYFIFRYFCSPGEKRKRLFHFFEESFFLIGFPAAVFSASPGKWEKDEMVLFLLLPFLTCLFFSLIFFLAEKGGMNQQTDLRKGKKLFCFSLPAVFAPFLVPCIYHTGGERIFSSLHPRGMLIFILLLLLAGSIASSGIFYQKFKAMTLREIPQLILVLLLSLAAVFFLIAAVSCNGIIPVLPPLLLMGMIQFSMIYRK